MKAWFAFACLALPIAAHADPEIRIDESAGLRARAWFPRNESPKRVELRIDDGPPIAADRVRLYADSDEPVDVVLAYETTASWIGTETYEPELEDGKPNNLRILGAHHMIEQALYEVSFHALPRGSTVTVLSYDFDATIEAPTTSSVTVLPRKLIRDQRSYRDLDFGDGLIVGVARALDILEATPPRRKVMLVIGGGEVWHEEKLFGLRERARRESVEIQAILWRGPLSDHDSFDLLTDDITDAQHHLTSAILERVQALSTPYEASFPVAALPLDGSTHRVELLVDGVVVREKLVTMPHVVAPIEPPLAPRPTREPMLIALVVLGLANVLLLAIRQISGR